MDNTNAKRLIYILYANVGAMLATVQHTNDDWDIVADLLTESEAVMEELKAAVRHV